MNSFISIEELAARMGMSAWWVYKHAGALGGVKVGGHWVFTEEGVRDGLLA